MIHKTYNYRHYQKWRHINWKKHILRMSKADSLPHTYDGHKVELSDDDDIGRHDLGSCEPYWSFKFDGQLDKGKTHCSCPMCRFRGYTISDRKAAEEALSQVNHSRLKSRACESELL